MADLSQATLSIAMIAGFLLAGGGVLLIIRQRDCKRGVLMVVAALVLVANVLIWTI